MGMFFGTGCVEMGMFFDTGCVAMGRFLGTGCVEMGSFLKNWVEMGSFFCKRNNVKIGCNFFPNL